MKRYKDCDYPGSTSDCLHCPHCIGRTDCHGRKIPNLAYLRTMRGITQATLADRSGVNIRQIRRVESGSSNAGNLTAKNLLALADALEADPHTLIDT